MKLFVIIFAVVLLSADAFTMSLTSGLCIRQLKLNKALKIALFFAIFQALMPLIGWKVGKSVIELIYNIGHWLSFGLLGILGIRMIDDALKTENEESKKRINPLETYTLFGLAFYSSLDELALGFTSGLTEEISIFTLSSLLGLVSFFLCLCGVLLSHRLGHKLGKVINSKVKLVGGTFLFVISIQIFWEHLFEQIVN